MRTEPPDGQKRRLRLLLRQSPSDGRRGHLAPEVKTLHGHEFSSGLERAEPAQRHFEGGHQVQDPKT